MISKPLIFVSSTSRLKEERRTLKAGIPGIYELYLYEEDRARHASPEEHCRRMIGESEVFVGVLGADYGSPFPGTGEKRSIVEWEFDTAMARSELETLAFIKQLAPGETREPAQQAFVERISRFRDGLWCKFYSTPDELVRSVRSDLEKWLAEVWIRAKEAGTGMRARFAHLLTAVVVAAVLLLLGVAAVLRTSLSASAFVGLAAMVACVVVLCVILLLTETGRSP